MKACMHHAIDTVNTVQQPNLRTYASSVTQFAASALVHADLSRSNNMQTYVSHSDLSRICWRDGRCRGSLTKMNLSRASMWGRCLICATFSGGSSSCRNGHVYWCITTIPDCVTSTCADSCKQHAASPNRCKLYDPATGEIELVHTKFAASNSNNGNLMLTIILRLVNSKYKTAVGRRLCQQHGRLQVSVSACVC